MPINLITMCVIIIKQKGMRLPVSVAKSSARINPHGLGIIWLDTFEVTYHESKDYRQLDTKRPFIAHFRYATIGAINRENTHPFECGANSKEWLMMNGTIQGLGNAQISDTKALAISLGEIPRHTWKAELEKHPCRFVTINTRKRTYQIYNKHLWTERDGIWYSKSNVLQDNLVAVYGTLKKGYSNYNRYLTSAKHVGAGHTKDLYPLVVSNLPYLIDEKGVGHNVCVDVFKVDDSTLSRLDMLEGHPRWYCRRQIQIKMKNGAVLSCWIYFNLQEKVGNRTLHQSYIQAKPKPYVYTAPVYDFSKKWEEKKQEEAIYEMSDKEWKAFLGEDDDFGVENEIPVCVNCFHDLESDFFNNHYCKHCDEWFGHSEVVKHKR